MSERQVIDVERLVEEVRERVALEREAREDGDPALGAPPEPPAAPHQIALPRATVSNKPVVGPIITFFRRLVLGLLALPLQDVVNQTNAAIAETHAANAALTQAITREAAVRQRMLEDEAAAREGGEEEIRAIKQRFDGIDTVLNALELAHRLAIADEAETRERVALDVRSLSERLDDTERKIEQAELVPRPRRSAHLPFASVFAASETPWSSEYISTHRRFVARMLDSADVLELFERGDELPVGYGVGLDERVVEYPWALAHLPGGRTLDAGSTLNHAHVLDRFESHVSELHIVTLTPEDAAFPERGISYIYADLRELPQRDDYYETILSLSTLEHVGMETGRYGGDRREGDPDGQLAAALAELHRVAAPAATFLASVPYGEAADLGWLRVFDKRAVEELVAALAPREAAIAVYAYSERGWERSDLETAAGARYRDFYADRTPVEDRAAAARAVACIRAVL